MRADKLKSKFDLRARRLPFRAVAALIGQYTNVMVMTQQCVCGGDSKWAECPREYLSDKMYVTDITAFDDTILLFCEV
jgi:hypothetical protein